MSQQQRISDRLAIVVLHFRQWTGETVLDKDDFQLGQGGKLPPDQVAHLGSKRICNPDDLKVFASIKQRAVRLLESDGVPYLGGWAIPLEKSQAVLMTLDHYVQEYEAAKATFLKRYDEAVQAWIAQNPEFRSEILRSVKTKSHVADRIRSGYSVFKVQALEGGSRSFEAAEAGLGETLLTEVAKTARELYRRSYAGKDMVTARAVDPIRRMRTRLAGLAFVDKAILPVVEAIDKTLSSIPSYGPYKAGDFHQLNAIVLVLSSEDRMRDLSQASRTEKPFVNDEFSLVSPTLEVLKVAKAPDRSSETIAAAESHLAPLPTKEGVTPTAPTHALDLAPDLDAELDAFLKAKSETVKIDSAATNAHESTTPMPTSEGGASETDTTKDAWTIKGKVPDSDVLPSIALNADSATSMFW